MPEVSAHLNSDWLSVKGCHGVLISFWCKKLFSAKSLTAICILLNFSI